MESFLNNPDPKLKDYVDKYLKEVLKIEIPFEWILQTVTKQEGKINCGIHTILNAKRYLLNQRLDAEVDMKAARNKIAVDLMAPLLQSKEQTNYIVDCECNYKCTSNYSF